MNNKQNLIDLGSQTAKNGFKMKKAFVLNLITGNLMRLLRSGLLLWAMIYHKLRA